ncbi:MAG: hypothetical protein QOJ59_5437 [Thermomicrobiales bacterium]|jgi:hypothetical protein|nr:hypothetical protein [Thermomicrobiales bacterium]
MRDIGERLMELESRLARLLAAGWRNAAVEAAGLSVEADAYAELGLGELAGRLRAVATASSATEALRSLTLASAACRLLRARVALDDQSEQAWHPLIVPRRRRAIERDMLLPLCRLSLGGTEVWSCLRSRGFAVEWVLVEPPTSLPGEGSPWLRKPMYGHLQWRARYPLGAGRDVQVQALPDASWESQAPTAVDPHTAFRKRLAAGKLREDKLPVWGGGSVHLAPLDHSQLDGYLWLDPTVPGDLAGMRFDATWALVWDQEATPAVIAVMAEGVRLFKKLSVVHLLGGCPSETVD